MGVGRNKFRWPKIFEIEIKKLRKPAAGETYCICHRCTQIINRIMNAIYNLKYIKKNFKNRNLMKLKYRSDESPPQSKLFYGIKFYHSRIQITNEIVKVICSLKYIQYIKIN